MGEQDRGRRISISLVSLGFPGVKCALRSISRGVMNMGTLHSCSFGWMKRNESITNHSAKAFAIPCRSIHSRSHTRAQTLSACTYPIHHALGPDEGVLMHHVRLDQLSDEFDLDGSRSFLGGRVLVVPLGASARGHGCSIRSAPTLDLSGDLSGFKRETA